jgi:hypothetical protein
MDEHGDIQYWKMDLSNIKNKQELYLMIRIELVQYKKQLTLDGLCSAHKAIV